MSIRRLGHLIGALCWGASALAWGQGVTPGEIRSYSTPQSIGVEWDVTGDGDHDAEVKVEYRVQGGGGWSQASPLFRVDHDGINMLAGSLFFLESATSYDVRLALTDPDGGAETREVTVETGPIPRLAEEGPRYHVSPGSGGGAAPRPIRTSAWPRLSSTRTRGIPSCWAPETMAARSPLTAEGLAMGTSHGSPPEMDRSTSMG